MNFKSGFEKIAVSMKFINTMVGSGVAGRAATSAAKGGPRVGNLIKGVAQSMKASKDLKASSTLGSRLKDTALSLNPRTHYKDLSEAGRKSMREGVSAMGKMLPKE